MKVFFRNIPEHTKPNELARFVTPFLKKSFINPFKAKGQVIRHNVVAQTDREKNVVRHHGLVTIEPDAAGARMLKRIRRMPFNGRKIIIREFVDRTYENDRRNYQSKLKVHPQRDLRCTDRRQHGLEAASNFRISFSHQENFTRKYD